MIGVIHEPRGERVAGLIYYLYGPGRHEEHTDPHIVHGLAASGRAGAAAAPRRHAGLPETDRPAQPAARGDGQVRVPPPGVAPVDARRPAGQGTVRRRVGADRPRRDEPHRAVPRRAGRRRRPVDRGPARRRPHPRRGDAGPPGPPPRPPVLRTAQRAGGVPGRRGTLRAGVHRARRPDRAPPPLPRRDRQSRPPRPGRAPARHAAPPCHHRRRRGGQRAGVLRAPRPRRGAGPPAVQREEPRPGHRVRGRPARRHGQRRRPGVVRRRQARPRPHLAQAPPAVDRPRHRIR